MGNAIDNTLGRLVRQRSIANLMQFTFARQKGHLSYIIAYIMTEIKAQSEM